MRSSAFPITIALAVMAASAPVCAQDQASPPWPRVGGHFGLALSVVPFDKNGPAAIARELAQVGVAPGFTLRLDPHWSIDFEFIAFSRWDRPSGSQAIFVIDPGVICNFGRVAAGVRLALRIGESVPLDVGIVPIIVLPFEIDKELSYFLELDLPLLVFGSARLPAVALTPATDSHVVGSLAILVHSGLAF